LLLTACLAVLFSITATRESVSVDAHAASVQAWRIASVGSPWLDDIAGSDEVAQDFFISEASNGHVVAMRMAGPVLLGVPAYALLHRDPDPTRFTLTPAGVAASVTTAFSVLLLYLAVRRFVGEAASLAGAAVFALATPTWSVSADGLWTHTLTQFGIAGAAYALSRDRWWLAGVLLGAGMLGRPHLAVVAAIVGLGLAATKRSLLPALGIGIPTLASLGLLAAWNRWMFGSFSVGGAYSGRVEAAANGQAEQWANYLGFLVSPDRGLFVWSPMLIVLGWAMIRHRAALPDWSWLLVLGGVVYSVVQMRINHFAGGDAFYGYRHGLELLTCVAPAGVIAVASAGRRLQAVVALLAGIQFAAISVGAVSDSFLLPLSEAWRSNSFAVAVAHNPLLLGAWTLLCALIAVLLHTRITTARERSAVGVGYRPTVPPTEE
jgi:alpha-1,2-mannosyltransferase